MPAMYDDETQDLFSDQIDDTLRRRSPLIRPLLAPNLFEDFREPITHFVRIRREAFGVRRLFVVSGLQKLRRDHKLDCGRGELLDAEGNVLPFLAMGKAAPLMNYLLVERSAYYLAGRLVRQGQRLCLLEPEPIEDEVMPKIRAVYPVAYQTIRAVNEDIAGDAQSYLAPLLAQRHLRNSLAGSWQSYLTVSVEHLKTVALKSRKGFEAAFVDFGLTSVPECRQKFIELLSEVHFPQDWDGAHAALGALRHIAAVSMLHDPIAKEAEHRKRMAKRWAETPVPRLDRALFSGSGDQVVARLAEHLPYPLTAEQVEAVKEILADLLSGEPMHRMLSGDVGSGKTAVYGCVARAAALSGLSVAVMLPSSTLAEQVDRNLREMNPDLAISYVSADRRRVKRASRIWVGTTALASECDEPFDLVIVDEQQKWGREMRESLCGERSHLLEVTATCIPRSLALVMLNEVSVTRLTGCHVTKEIVCSMVEDGELTAAIELARSTVAQGGQVVVVYPAKRESTHMVSLKDDREAWEAAFPGRVCELHSDQTANESSAEIAAVHEGRADILLATTKVEVGIDVAGLRRAIVMQPERFGLSTLHQIRGRVARAGGTGWCDLVLRKVERTGASPEDLLGLPIEEDDEPGAAERLAYFCRTSSGFDVAHYDMIRRGTGDVSSHGHRQSGNAFVSPFPGLNVPNEALIRASLVLRKIYGLREDVDLDNILAQWQANEVQHLNRTGRILDRGIPMAA